MRNQRNNPWERPVDQDESNLREDGTTVDGGFPRHKGSVNPHDSWKVVLHNILEMLLFCIPLLLIFRGLLEFGLWEPIQKVLDGHARWSANSIKSVAICVLFTLVIVGFCFSAIANSIWYVLTGEKSFKFWKPIKKVWDKNLGTYVYRQ